MDPIAVLCILTIVKIMNLEIEKELQQGRHWLFSAKKKHV